MDANGFGTHHISLHGSTMRVLLFWSYYDGYLESRYNRSPSLSQQPSEAQLEALLGDYVGWVPYVVQRMRADGHETCVVVANAKPLQRQWASERGVVFDDATWRFAIPMEQVKAFAPDVLIIGSMFGYYGEYLARLRKLARTVVAWVGVSPPPLTDFSGIDLVLTSHANLQSRFRRQGLKCERLLPAFEPRVLDAAPAPRRTIPVSFMGSLSWAHRSRIRLLRRISEQLPLDLRVSMPPVTLRTMLRPGFVPALLAARPLLAASLEPVFGLRMFDVLRRSQVGLNVHIHEAQGLAGNMRMFETTGAGAVLLTEDAPNLHELFEPGEEVVAYRCAEDLVRIARSLLAEDARLKRIAAAGQRRTLRDHSSAQRATELSALLSA